MKLSRKIMSVFLAVFMVSALVPAAVTNAGEYVRKQRFHRNGAAGTQ